MIVDMTKKKADLDLEQRQICIELMNNHALAARILGLAKVVTPNCYPDLVKFMKIICKSKK